MSFHLSVLQNLRNVQQLVAQKQMRRERVFRDRQNPFEFYNDVEFNSRFRFTKENAMFVIDLISDDIRFDTDRSHALPPYLQVLIALRFYGNGAFQITVGYHINIHQSTVSRIIKRVSIALG
jgi:hypothetical protein